MRSRALGTCTLILVTAFGAPPARASTLPAADAQAGASAGAGLAGAGGWPPGWAASLDTSVWPSLNLGASLAAGAGGVASWSVRALYRLVLGDAGSPSVAALAAAWGAPGRPGGGPPRPAVGFALAYAPRTSLTLRLDLGYSFPTPGAATRWAFLGGAPCFGAEAAWLVSDGLEVTLGLTGAGEVLGLRAQF